MDQRPCCFSFVNSLPKYYRTAQTTAGAVYRRGLGNQSFRITFLVARSSDLHLLGCMTSVY